MYGLRLIRVRNPLRKGWNASCVTLKAFANSCRWCEKVFSFYLYVGASVLCVTPARESWLLLASEKAALLWKRELFSLSSLDLVCHFLGVVAML